MKANSMLTFFTEMRPLKLRSGLYLLAIVAGASSLNSLRAAILATDGSQADVQAKINAAVDGDIVTIPAGTFVWTSSVTISGKAIHLQGAGADRVLARSDSSVSVGTGTKAFTLVAESIPAIEALKSQIIPGTTLRIWRAGGEIDITKQPAAWRGITGNLPWMEGTVVSLTSGTLTLNISSANHSGTHSPWIVTTKPRSTIVINTPAYTAGLTVHERAGKSVEVSGLQFTTAIGATENLRMVSLHPTEQGEPILIHDCSFNPQVNGTAGLWSYTNRGIVWNCSFNNLPAGFGSNHGISVTPHNFTTSWTSPSTMGTADTNGRNNFYIESCDFHFNIDVLDGSDNARIVVRNSLFNNAGIGMHGPDTSWWGVRHYELYDLEFVFSNPPGGTQAYFIAGFFIPRGGTGLMTNCIIPDINSPLSWGDNSEILLQIQMLTRNSGPNPLWGSNSQVSITNSTTASPTVISTVAAHGKSSGDFVRITGSNSSPSLDGYHQITKLTDFSYAISFGLMAPATQGQSNRVDYPAPRQIGLGYVTGTGRDGKGRVVDPFPEQAWPGGYVGDSEPLYFWNNTGARANAVSVDSQDQGQASKPDLASDYIKLNRDYFVGTAKPGWSKPTGDHPAAFPHPLRGLPRFVQIRVVK